MGWRDGNGGEVRGCGAGNSGAAALSQEGHNGQGLSQHCCAWAGLGELCGLGEGFMGLLPPASPSLHPLAQLEHSWPVFGREGQDWHFVPVVLGWRMCSRWRIC